MQNSSVLKWVSYFTLRSHSHQEKVKTKAEKITGKNVKYERTFSHPLLLGVNGA